MSEIVILTMLYFLLFFSSDRSWQFLWWHWGHDWLQTKPMDEMELDHNHSRPLHGEWSESFFFFSLLEQLWPSDTSPLSRSQVGLRHVLKGARLFSRAVLSSLWWSTSPWPTTRCTSTLTGPSVWAGAWPCPPWSASPWWWSSRSYNLRDHWSR